LKDAPLLAVEIVSPSSQKTDYKIKEQEYKSVGISEYWIVDLKKYQVIVLLLIDGIYKQTEFSGNNRIVSFIFPNLTLTTQQILAV
jgi:Uma2 family endonuclease